ncbi:glycosyltransferase family 4 protein [Rhodoplanes sp. SY1]|uniref:glycosyltransferase family 4 protein n=1 Tax=Rhodoplanes sp. SY1 TaxID=3166646 RepID=UPI0038B699B7
MRILFVAYLYYPDITGGAARSVQALAEALVELGHEVHVLRFGKNGTEPDCEVNGVLVHHLKLRNIYWPFDRQKRTNWKRAIWHLIDLINPYAAFDVWRAVRRIRPDIVNTSIISGFSSSIFWVFKAMRVPTIHTMRDYYMLCAKVGMYRGNRNCVKICSYCRPFSIIRSQGLRQVDMILANSRFVLNRHRCFGAIPESTPAYVQLNMNFSPVRVDPRTRPDAVVRFGFLGKLDDTKGVGVLLGAVGLLGKEGWTLRIGGEGDSNYVAQLKQNCNDPRIEFIGWVNEKTFYDEIDVLICPSLYHDPLPRVILEAYSNAIPVIVSDRGGLPEMVENKVTGIICNPSNLESLAEAMRAFINGTVDYPSMSRAAIAAASAYTRDAVVASYLVRLTELNIGEIGERGKRT